MSSQNQHGPTVAFFIEGLQEEAIENKQFLESYLRFGAWIRFVQVHENLKKLREAESEFIRLNAVLGFYMALGALLEDVAANLFALACAGRSQNALLANALYLTTFRRDSTAQPSLNYIIDRADAVARNKKVNVDISALATSLQQLGVQRSLEILGIAWKQVPSVRIAKSASEREWWEKLPAIIGDISRILSDPANSAIGLVYNKVKHGPQLIIADLSDQLAATGASLSEARTAKEEWAKRGLTPNTIRVLFRGARTTRLGDEEFPPTLFIEDDLEPFLVSYELVAFQSAKAMWTLSAWLYRVRYGGRWIELPPEIVQAEKLIGELKTMRKVSDFVGSKGQMRHKLGDRKRSNRKG